MSTPVALNVYYDYTIDHDGPPVLGKSPTIGDPNYDLNAGVDFPLVDENNITKAYTKIYPSSQFFPDDLEGQMRHHHHFLRHNMILIISSYILTIC